MKLIPSSLTILNKRNQAYCASREVSLMIRKSNGKSTFNILRNMPAKLII